MQVENSLIFSPRNQHYIPSRVPEGYTSGNTWDPWLVGEEGRERKKKGEMPLCVSTYKLFFFFLPISFYLQSFLPLIPLLLQFSSRNIEIHCPRCHVQFSSVQSLSHVWLFVTPWIAACQASLSITNSLSLLKLMPIESVMPSSHLILCHPLLLLPPIPPSIRVFSNESTLHVRWPKYWSFNFSISPSNEHTGLISWVLYKTKSDLDLIRSSRYTINHFFSHPKINMVTHTSKL